MAKYLVIVESPAKVKTIKKFLGANYEVMASNGHVRDFPKSQFGIDVDHDYEPKYITIRGKGEILAKLRKEAKKADKVYLATDPDREGEAISWHLSKALGLEDKKMYRITFNEITKTAVKESLKHARQIDMNFTDGTALLTLKHNEKKTAIGLPADVHYEVTEAEANQNGYTTTAENASGIIVKDTTVVASFTNNKNSNPSGGQPTGTTPTPGNNSSDKPTGTTSTNSNHSENITGLASSPQTGDQNNLTLWIVLLVGSLLGLTGIVNVVVKKSRHREKYTK